LTTKIAALVDALGNLVRFVLLSGQRHDVTSFDVLMAGIACLAFIGDKAFDANRLRKYLAGLRHRGCDSDAQRDFRTTLRMTRKSTSGATSSKTSSARSRFRRIATRYEKTDTCFAAMINLVAIVLWTR